MPLRQSSVTIDTNYCAIGLSNPKTPSNVGSVLRACQCFSADAVFYTGNRYNHAMKFNTDTSKSDNPVPLTHTGNLTDAINAVDACIICVELVENATALPSFVHPPRGVYVFGPEDSNLSQEVIDCADQVVFIPTNGCLNLAASVNLVLYDRAMKRSAPGSPAQNNALVRNSRDCRNNLKVQATAGNPT